MRKIILILIIFTAIIGSVSEYWALRKNKHYRDIIVSASFLVVGILLGVLQLYKVDIPSPMAGIQTIFQPISQFFVKLLS